MQDRRTILLSLAGTMALPGLALAGGHGQIASFRGASGHEASGRAEIAGDTVTLLDDFRLDGGPDPKVALGRDGYDSATLMGPLKSLSGKQSYTVPAGIDASAYNEVYIWCERFNVPLAIAPIN